MKVICSIDLLILVDKLLVNTQFFSILLKLILVNCEYEMCKLLYWVWLFHYSIFIMLFFFWAKLMMHTIDLKSFLCLLVTTIMHFANCSILSIAKPYNSIVLGKGCKENKLLCLQSLFCINTKPCIHQL